MKNFIFCAVNEASMMANTVSKLTRKTVGRKSLFPEINEDTI